MAAEEIAGEGPGPRRVRREPRGELVPAEEVV
jgi:hypothetical protein